MLPWLFVLGLLLPPPLGAICLWLLFVLVVRRLIVGPPGSARNNAAVGTAVLGLLLIVPILGLFPARAQASGHSERSAALTASNDCRAYYESVVLSDGPVQIATVHLNVGMCNSGSGYVREWGPDCYVSGSVVWGGGTTWCGVFANGRPEAQPGANFYLFPFSLPDSRKGGSVRLTLLDGLATVTTSY